MWNNWHEQLFYFQPQINRLDLILVIKDKKIIESTTLDNGAPKSVIHNLHLIKMHEKAEAINVVLANEQLFET